MTWGSREPLPEAHRKARAALDNAMSEYAADPELRRHMRCWMVDFCGDTEPEWYKRASKAIAENRPVEETLSPEELKQAINGEVDALSRRVAAWLESVDANVTDSGSGAGGWHLGAHCTQTELDSLTTLARETFAKEIAEGALKLRVQFWGWRFPSTPLRDGPTDAANEAAS
jgi:hypothetical protein